MGLWRNLKAVQVYGANTEVGKTVVSTILCRGLRDRLPQDQLVRYLKPISTGPDWQADDRHIRSFSRHITSDCLFQFDRPVSPHIAANVDGFRPPSDADVLAAVRARLESYAETPGVALVETAGGVLSPAPSGSLQADLYRPLRLPVLLVGDPKLGGIGTTLSAFESLHLRGYDLDALVLFTDDAWGNAGYLRDHFRRAATTTVADLPVYTLPPPPPRQKDPAKDEELLLRYYSRTARSDVVAEIVERIEARHAARIRDLESLAPRAHRCIWHPFTQHQGRTPADILTIDSAYGEDFLTLKPDQGKESTEKTDRSPPSSTSTSLLTPTTDASASWWTQGLGHGNPDLARTAAYAAGRYGHVMFAGAAHEPAVALAETLLAGHANPRLARVFYTDNGSTGVEVGVKMAVHAAAKRYGWAPGSGGPEIEILGLRGSYHGDTIGAMDLSEPSVFNAQVEWYRPRGHWFAPPTLRCSEGRWVLTRDDGVDDDTHTFARLDDAFDFAARADQARVYRAAIEDTLTRLVRDEGRRFGALVLEPLVLGAGGMILVDPLYHHTLAAVIRSPFTHQLLSLHTPLPPTSNNSTTWLGLPILHDEVFTGLHRLGPFTPSSILHTPPDIVVNAKLLTGGTLPLCATAASDPVFAAFLGPHKPDALLHGHSYTAHPVGCAVANAALRAFRALDAPGGRWEGFRDRWRCDEEKEMEKDPQPPRLWSVFPPSLVRDLSFAPRVRGVFALGSLLVVELKEEAAAAAAGTGNKYASTAAADVQRRLLEECGVHARVLGPVVYVMTGQMVTLEEVDVLGSKLRGVLMG